MMIGKKGAKERTEMMSFESKLVRTSEACEALNLTD